MAGGAPVNPNWFFGLLPALNPSLSMPSPGERVPVPERRAGPPPPMPVIPTTAAGHQGENVPGPQPQIGGNVPDPIALLTQLFTMPAEGPKYTGQADLPQPGRENMDQWAQRRNAARDANPNFGQGVTAGSAPAAPPDPDPENAPQAQPKPDTAPQAPQAVSTPPQGAQPTGQPVGPDFGLSLGGPQVSPPQPGLPQAQQLSREAAINAAMMQMGLSLMVPRWGGPLAQIGMALGEGGEAVGRAQDRLTEEGNQGLATQKTQAEIEATKALTGARNEASQTARSKRLSGTGTKSSGTEWERLAKGMGLGPKQMLYLKTRMKDMDNILDEELSALTPEQRFMKIIDEAKQITEEEPAAAAPAAKPAGNNPAGNNPGKVYKVGDRVKGDDGWYIKIKEGVGKATWKKDE